MDSKTATFYSAVIITSIVLGIIIIFFVLSIVRQHRRNVDLQRQKMLAEINTLEKERARIANDLHDDLGPVLSAVKFHVDAVDSADSSDMELLNKASNHLDNIIMRIREISNDLMPYSLIKKGLLKAIEQFLQQVTSSTNIQVELDHDSLPEMKEEITVNLYRIFQETVHNVVKHANATEIFIQIKTKEKKIHLLIRDNGVGFDINEVTGKTTGFGLKSLNNRVELMNGTMQAESKPGKGSAFLYVIPL